MSRALQRVAEVEHTSPGGSTAPQPLPAGWPRHAPPRHPAMSCSSATTPPVPPESHARALSQVPRVGGR